MKKIVTSDIVKVAIKNLEEIEKNYLAELSSLSEKNNNILENLSLEILELKDDANKLRKEKTILNNKIEQYDILLKTKEKQLEKYKKLLNITPGTLENKVELLEYFAETLIPHISEKIDSKYTSKIKEYLEREILNKSEEEGEKLYNLVLGTSLEYLFPYLYCGYILDIDYKILRGYIRNPSSLAFSNWKRDNFIGVKTKYGNLSCPIYSNKEIGIHNCKAFNEDCLNDLLNYLLETDNSNFVNFVQKFFKGILKNAELKRRYGLSQNVEIIDINQCEHIKRDALIGYLKERGLI